MKKEILLFCILTTLLLGCEQQAETKSVHVSHDINNFDLYNIYYCLDSLEHLNMDYNKNFIPSVINFSYESYDDIFRGNDGIEYMYYLYKISKLKQKSSNQQLEILTNKFNEDILKSQLNNGLFTFSRLQKEKYMNKELTDSDYRQLLMSTFMATEILTDNKYSIPSSNKIKNLISNRVQLITNNEQNLISNLGELSLLLKISENLNDYSTQANIRKKLLKAKDNFQFKGGEIDLVQVYLLFSIEEVFQIKVFEKNSLKNIYRHMESLENKNHTLFQVDNPQTMNFIIKFAQYHDLSIPNKKLIKGNLTIYFKKMGE